MAVLFTLALMILLVFAVGKVVLLLATSAVVLSKVVVSLVVALALSSANSIVDNSWLNFGIWAAICLTVCFLLCRMPRFNFAFQFLCTSVVSYVIAGMLVMAIGPMVNKAYEPTLLLDVATKVACAVISVRAVIQQIKKAQKLSLFANPIWVNLERLMASVLYGAALTVLFGASIYGVGNVSDVVILIVLIGSPILAFLADCFLLDRIHEKLKTVHQKEMAAAAVQQFSGSSEPVYDPDFYDDENREPTFSEWLSQEMVETEEFLADTDYLDDPDYYE